MINIIQKIDVQAVLIGEFQFSPDFPISKKSTFGSRFWDFYDESLVRHTSVPKKRLQIDWNQYCTGDSENEDQILPEKIIQELKLFTALYYLVPEVFAPSSKGVKPQTPVVTFRALSRFFSTIYRESILIKFSSNSPLTHIQSIADITLSDIRKTLIDSPYKDGDTLKKGLSYLASGVIRRYFGKPVDAHLKLTRCAR